MLAVLARVLLILWPLANAAAVAQPDASSDAANTVAHSPEVIVVVNGVALLSGELELRWSQLAEPDRELSDAELAGRRSRLLDVLIQQQLVLDYLQQRSRGGTYREVDRAFQGWVENLGVTPDDYYAATGLNESAVRRRLAWQLSWPRFIETRLSEKRLKEYFASRRREFDGTRLRVAHILWQVSREEPQRPTVRQAAKVRQSILSGELSFEAAARRYSQAPSAENGGEIGWIERHYPMDPAFSTAAFALQEHELSEPVVTPFGVHLIKYLEIEAGQRNFEQVRTEVQRAARQELFRSLAKRQRKTAQIELP